MKYRPAAERFHSQFDWLDSWHSFSFGGHYDPAWTGFGPLLVINDDSVAAGKGFGMHPHRDMEIITVMVEGQVNHRDSMGHASVLKAGEVQRMSAGTGVVHSEMNLGENNCRFLQIWIQPNASGLDPAYEQKPFLIGRDWTRLLDPRREEGAMAIARDVHLWRAKPRVGDQLSMPDEGGDLLWLQVIDGSISWPEMGDDPVRLKRGDGVGIPRQDPRIQQLQAEEEKTDVLLFAFQ